MEGKELQDCLSYRGLILTYSGRPGAKEMVRGVSVYHPRASLFKLNRYIYERKNIMQCGGSFAPKSFCRLNTLSILNHRTSSRQAFSRSSRVSVRF